MTKQLFSLLQEQRLCIREGAGKGRKTGLVVQGGGMRGVYSMACLAAFEAAGLSDAFNYVVGSSAGAINGAYFLARQAKLAVSVYLDDISCHEFVSFLRVRRIVDIDFLVDEALSRRKQLNIEAVRHSVSSFDTILTDFHTGRPFVVNNRDDTPFMEVMRATAAMPILYGKPVPLFGREFIDGGLADQVPIVRAVDHGCTDIVVILTRPIEFRRQPLGFIGRGIFRLLTWSYPRQCRDVLLSGASQTNRSLEYLSRMAAAHDAPRIYIVAPSSKDMLVSRLTTDRGKLLTCAEMGFGDANGVLGLPSGRLV